MRIRKNGEVDGRCTRFPPPMTAEDFWALASPIPYLGCWICMASHERSPYGSTRVEGTKETQANRVAWVLTYGPIPPGLVVMHDCDVKGCVNPAHLSLGTVSQNSIDAYARGRIRGRGAHRVITIFARAMHLRSLVPPRRAA